MASIRPGASQEEIQRHLTLQAETLLGKERSEAIKAFLEQTAGQLHQVGRVLPKPEVEPGYYQ